MDLEKVSDASAFTLIMTVLTWASRLWFQEYLSFFKPASG
mgnify:CR=1 FL=1